MHLFNSSLTIYSWMSLFSYSVGSVEIMNFDQQSCTKENKDWKDKHNIQ